MQELTQLIGIIATLVAITLKAIISSTNALSYSSPSSLGGHPIFALHSIWSGTADPVSDFSSHATVVPVVTPHKCVPAEYDSTQPGSTRYQYNNSSTPAQYVFVPPTTTRSAVNTPAAAHRRHQKKIARRIIMFFETTLIAPKMVSNAWSSRGARWLRKAIFRWAIAVVVFLEEMAEPDFADAVKLVIDALARLARKRGYIARGRRSKKTTRRRCLVHPKYRYYEVPHLDINDLNGAYSLKEMPLVPHSFLGHGIMQLRWHATSVWYSADNTLPERVEQTEVLFEIRLAHCTVQQRDIDIDGPSKSESESGRGAQWTHHTRKCVASRVADDRWFCIIATRDEVYFTGNGYTETICALEKKYVSTVPEEI